MPIALDTIEFAVARIAAGQPVVVVDDEDRENEGDLVMAAARATPEHVALMIRHTSGILCTPLPQDAARRLNLWPMVADNNAPQSTAFTVSVDYRHGLTTGISADERCATIRALADPRTKADDLVRPGHIFPLIAKEGGVLIRTGHTEAAVDLARLAGLPPVGLIAELVNDNGSVKKGAEIEDFARQHRFAIISIADLIAYRLQRDSLVRRIGERSVATTVGPASAAIFATPFDNTHHFALVFGDVGDGRNVLTRLHREDSLVDLFSPSQSPIAQSLEQIKKSGRGVIVYLRQGSAAVVDRDETAYAASRRETHEQWREIGLGAQILKNLGVRSIRVLATRPRQYVALSGFGIEVVATEILGAAG